MEEVESDEQNEVARYRDVAARIRGAMAGEVDSGADTGRYLGLPAWRRANRDVPFVLLWLAPTTQNDDPRLELVKRNLEPLAQWREDGQPVVAAIQIVPLHDLLSGMKPFVASLQKRFLGE